MPTRLAVVGSFVAVLCCSLVLALPAEPEFVENDSVVPESNLAEWGRFTSFAWLNKLRGWEFNKGSYKRISCPVMRALVGSKFLQLKTTEKDVLNSMCRDLGFGYPACNPNEFPLKIFKGAVKKQIEKYGPTIDLRKIHEFFDHGASSGIIGTATTGTHDDHVVADPAGLHRLLSFARGRSFTASQFGDAVNHFAEQGFNNRKAFVGTPADWKGAPVGRFSWGILTAEYANTFAAFEENGVLPTSTVLSLWRDAVMPMGFVRASHRNRRITKRTIAAIGGRMNIKIPCEQINTMRANPKDGPAPVVQLFCGSHYNKCKASRFCWKFPTFSFPKFSFPRFG